ncbi:amino acid adenylation domain-containing protein [Mucilaginibacter sp. 21P]|uniref:non-ribosomal peptide synthetase n=1 Tax=Mucilaginibacter sp. 21P TaxID=2778902 RepID=UPI001C567266|nr:amino acid adenylation domain-containing protein [Mucilaginibacter sp. 21P]QXV63896.1 amino acid adenylation domain-containing protein [Mucilaginibacter sp. 21P]
MKKPVNEMHSSAAGFRKTVLDEWNNTQQSFDEHVTIQKLFERQVTLTPDNKAVFFGDEVVTYQELNNKANKLALRLHVAGIKPETIVGIVCERSLEMMFGILGIIKAGGAYLPLSPNDPSERLNIIIQDSALPVLLMQRKFAGKLDFDGLIIYLDDFAADDGMLVGNLPIVNKSTDLLYVIYTSGSTGMPKGVMIEHRSLVNRLTWMQQAYPLTADDIILQKTPYNFDVSVWELFWWMLTGAAVCLLMPNGEKNPIAIINTVNDKKISVMHFVPSMLGVFIDYIRGKDTIAALSSLRLIFTSGEALLPAHVEGFYKELNSMNGKRLINLYGPTEATVDVTHHECTEGDNLRSVTIGKPISNTRIYIVDGQNELIGANDEGQLLIAGTGVARGYLNRVELTAEKFIDDIFHGAGKLYKSGDLASWGPDGNINFIGRMDHQVKIRGLRIELGEIEAVLIKHPLVKESLLHVWRYSESVIIIAAYYVASIDIEQVELKAFMKKCLPEYMVPSCFIRVDAFPLSVNGKIDRKALPDPLVATL